MIDAILQEKTVSNSEFWMMDEERVHIGEGVFAASFVVLCRDDNRSVTLVKIRAAIDRKDRV